ncbi:MAG: DUF354 domain-containing protein [Candidatus Binatia bacterium]
MRIWVDVSNSPHVLFFEPVIRELERRGHAVTVTSRRFANTQALIAARGMRARTIGAGHDASRNELLKRAHFEVRAAQLMAFARQRFDVAASHFSHTQAAAARRLGIPTFCTVDYEHGRMEVFAGARRVMVPSVIPAEAFEASGIPARVIRHYDGLKEHVYLTGFRPREDSRRCFGIDPAQPLVVFRPIADHAHYNDGGGLAVQRRLLVRLARQRGVAVVVLPRTAVQRREYETLTAQLPALRLPRRACDGPSLICAADLVVCGGGTMLREAAVLGVPAVSIFSGKVGAVDRWLAAHGKVTLVPDDAAAERVRVERRDHAAPVVDGPVLEQIVEGICATAASR